MDADPEIRQNAIRENLTLFAGAKDIGAKYIVLHLHCDIWERTDEERFILAKQAIEAMLPEAERTGIVMAIENLRDEWSVRQINALLGFL